MKKKIYKALSLLLVLAVLVTTCAHGNWFVANAADEPSFITSTVKPAMSIGNLNGSGALDDSNQTRIRTNDYYAVADFESVTVPTGYQVYVHFYKRQNSQYVWCGKANTWKDGTNNIAELLPNAVLEDNTTNAGLTVNNTHYFRVVIKALNSNYSNPTTTSDYVEFKLKSHNTALSAPTIAQGTIDTGAVMPGGTTRLYTSYMIPVADYKSLSVPTGYEVIVHYYDATGKWLQNNSWTSDGSTVTLSTTATYFKAVIAKNPRATATTALDAFNSAGGLALTPSTIPVTGVTLDKTTANLLEGETVQLTATVTPNDATDQTGTWASSATGVATVSNSGLVTAISAGTANITFTTTDGSKVATCTVTVTEDTTPNYDFVYGTIESGVIKESGNNRVRTASYIPIDAVYAVEISRDYQMFVYVYDENENYLGSTDDWVDYIYTTAAMTNQWPTAKYFKVVLKHSDNESTKFADLEFEDSEVYFHPIEEAPETKNLDYYVSETGKESNDALSASNAVLTINQAIKRAIANGAGKDNTVTVHVDGTINWKVEDDGEDGTDRQLTTHLFKLVITSTNENSLGTVATTTKENKLIHMGGAVEFDEIQLSLQDSDDILFFKNNSVTYSENVVIVGDNKIPTSLGAYESKIVDGKYQASRYDKETKVEIKAPINKVYLSNFKGVSTIDADMHLHYNCEEGDPTFYLGSQNGGRFSVVYNAGIDMIVDAANSITFKETQNIRFGPNGYLQVLNNSGKEIDSQVALDNASSVWIVNNEVDFDNDGTSSAEEKACIQFTGLKGIYTVSGENKVYIFNGNEQVGESRKGQINLAALGAGIYTLKAESKSVLPTYTPKDGETIADIIVRALEAQPKDTTELYDRVKIDLSNYNDSIDFGNVAEKVAASSDSRVSALTEHNFEVLIQSEGDATVNFTEDTTFFGDMIFENVMLSADSSRKIYLDGHNLEIDELTTLTNIGTIYSAKSSTDSTYQDQKINIAAEYSGVIYLGLDNGTNVTTYNGDLNLIINNKSSDPIVYSTYNANSTLYKSDLNINIKGANNVNIKNLKLVNAVDSVQIIRDNAATVEFDGSEVDNFTTVEGSPVKFDIVDDTYIDGVLETTKTAGTFITNTEFLVTAEHTDGTLAYSKDTWLELGLHGKWTLTTTDYFEDFKDMSEEEFAQTWSWNGIYNATTNTGANASMSGTGKVSNEKVFLTSAPYLINNDREAIVTNKNITARNQYISIDFTTEDLLSTTPKSTSPDQTKIDNIRDNGSGIALYSRLNIAGTAGQGYELKVARNRIILTKRDVNDSNRWLSNNNTTCSNVTYKKYYTSNSEGVIPESEYNGLSSTDKAKYDQVRYEIASCDFEIDHIKSYTKYNRFPESYDEGNQITLNPTHIYRLGLSVVDGEAANIAYVRILLLDVTTNTLVVDETFKDINATNFTGEHFGFGLYGVTSKDIKETVEEVEYTRYCTANFDNVWFSTEHFRGGDMGEFNDINYDSFFDIRDLVRTYEYMGGANARINFSAADRDYNGYITTSDESEIRKELLHDGTIEFRLKGQKDDLADERREEILSVGKASGSGVVKEVALSTALSKGNEAGATHFRVVVADSNDNIITPESNVLTLITTGDTAVSPTMVQGSIRTDLNGQVDPNANNRIYTSEYLKISDYKTIMVASGYKLYYHYYNNPTNAAENWVSVSSPSWDTPTGTNYYYPDLSKTEKHEVTGNVYYVSTSATAPSDVAVANVASSDRFVAGGIDRNGMPTTDSDKVYSKYFIKLDDKFTVTAKSSAQVQCFIYDKDFNYLGRTGSTTNGTFDYTYLTTEANFTDDTNARRSAQLKQGLLTFEPKYVKFVLNKSGISANDPSSYYTTNTDIVISGIDYHKNDECTQDKPWTFHQLQVYADAQTITFDGRQDPFVLINSGDIVLFKRGDDFVNTDPTVVTCLEGQAVASYASFFAQQGVIYGAYGTGDKPVLNASAKEYANEEWTQVGDTNIYYCDVSDITKYTNLRDNSVLNVIFNDGEKIGVRKYYAEDLHTLYKEGQYATDVANGRLYLYCEGMSPAEKYSSINLTRCIYSAYINIHAQNIIIDNIKFKGFGGGAIRGSLDCPNNTVQNCDIGYSGGMMYTRKEGQKWGLRYGNAVEMWEKSEKFVIKDCWIYHTFDSAVSPQGDGNSTGEYDGFTLTGNLFEYNNCDLEYFDDIAKDTSDTVLTNVDIIDNIFRFTAFGWGTRESDKIRGIQGVLRMDMRYDNKISIDYTNNVIDTPGMEIFRIKNYDLKKSDGTFSGLYQFGYEYNLGDIPGTTELGNNEYYLNYYVRNYPYIATDFATTTDEVGNSAITDRRADSDGQFKSNLQKIDWASTSKFYWYSTEIN